MIPGNIYHIYNRGIDKQRVFFSEGDYVDFKKRIWKHLLPTCDLLGYCLMPNHFHLLIYVRGDTVEPVEGTEVVSILKPSRFARGLQQLLSGYAKMINRRSARVGSLFCQNTRQKDAGDGSLGSYACYCLYYLHMNPVRASFAQAPAEWGHSSYGEYFNGLEGLCNTALGAKKLYLNFNDLEFDSIAARRVMRNMA